MSGECEICGEHALDCVCKTKEFNKMVDIMMCQGGECPLKEGCKRFKSNPGYVQSYFVEPPIFNGKCEYFMPLVNFKIVNDQFEIAD